MKTCCFFLVLIFAPAAFATPKPMSVKERVRLSLWYDGLHKKKVKKHKLVQGLQELPEELSRPLSRI